MPFIITLLCYLSASTVFASGGDPNGLKIERLGTPGELISTLNTMHARFDAICGGRQTSFELQKMIADQSGECISRLVDLSQNADLSRESEKEAFKAVFLKNGDLLRRMLAYNQTRADDLLEAKLEQIQDKDAFFASAEWQQPQYLISAVSYWLGWNNYYAALLYQAGEKTRAHLLDEAVSGFTRTLPDLKEQSLANRCIFGRALCFKEQRKYDKALQDIESLMAKVSRDDILYVQAGYERALISHLSGKNDLAVTQMQRLLSDAGPSAMTQQIREQIKSLQTKIALEIAEKSAFKRENSDTDVHRTALRELRHIAESDVTQAGVVYRYVFERAEQLKNMPDEELGSIGSMAMADWDFERNEYDLAGDRYRRLYAAPDTFIKAYLDGLCFRLAYCYSLKQQWQDALECLETLFEKYPGSSFDGKAACLYHAVAAHAYQAQPSEGAYDRYIKAAECYIKNCPETQDKSEAHYQLGRSYQQRGRTQEALIQFSRVGSDSPHYPEARHGVLVITVNTLRFDVEELESLNRDGRGQSDKALQLYRGSLKRAEECRKAFARPSTQGDDRDLEAYLTLLLARLYLHVSEPSPRKALQLLRGFEEAYRIDEQQDVLHDMAQKLRLECYLQLDMLGDAEQEVAAITGKAAVDKKTWVFLNECASRYYTLAKQHPASATHDGASRPAEAAMVIYAGLADNARRDAAYRNYYDSLQMRLAELYGMNHRPAQAAAIYQEKLQRDPTSADALYNLAVIYESEGRWEDAFATWNKLARGLNPGCGPWYEVRLRTAQSLIHLEKQKEACEVIAVTSSRCPDQRDEAAKRNYLQLRKEYCKEPDAAGAGKK